jgi:hypothetical protein
MLMNFSTWLPTLLSGGGTVTSVAVTVPSFMTVTGSPITTSGTIAISATSTGTGAVVLRTSPVFNGTISADNYQGLGTLSSGNIRAENSLQWGSNSFGNLSWNASGGSGEIAITNNYPTPEWHTIFYKHNGSPILRVGANGELVSSNITVQTSSGEDILKLFNSAQTNTIITIGRNNNTGNAAQIYTSYIGNNDASNAFTIAFGGKSPTAQFYNNFSSKFFGPVTVEHNAFSFSDAVFTIRNTSDRPRLSMALLAPNLLINEGIFSIHGKDTGAGNCMVTNYVHVSDNNPNNAYYFGFYGNANNLVLKNDLSSSFGGKLTVATGVRINNNGLFVIGNPDMFLQGAGMGWNYSN